MALPIANSFDTGQTTGTTITTGNSGGGTGNTAFAALTGSPTYSSVEAHSGTLSMLCASAAASHCQWSTTQLGTGQTLIGGRVYVYMTAYPTGASYRLVQMDGNATSDLLRLAVTVTTGTISTNVAGSSSKTSTHSLTLNAWNRIDFIGTVNGTTGTMQAELFLGANCDGTTPDETLAQSSFANTDTSIVEIYYGPQSSPAVSTVYIDDVQANATGYGGPSHVTINGTAAGSSTSTGAATGTAADHVISGTASGQSTSTGAATGHITEHGSGTGHSTSTGAATGHILEHGSGTGQSTSTGAATGTASNHAIHGTAAGSSTSTGAATGHIKEHGTAAGSSTSTGAATGHIGLHGTASGQSTSSGHATGTSGILPHGAGQSISTGSAIGTVGTAYVPTKFPLTTKDSLVVRLTQITLSPQGTDGSATANALFLAGRPGILKFIQVTYNSQPSTTDLVINQDSSSGPALFTATNCNTNIGPALIVPAGVSASNGAVAAAPAGVPFTIGLYLSIAQGNVSVADAKDIVVNLWIEY